MAWYTPKEWKDRLVEFAGRRTLKNVSTNETTVYDVTRNEGAVSQEGDSFSAAKMNDFDLRVKNAIDAAEEAYTQLSSDLENLKAQTPELDYDNRVALTANSFPYTPVKNGYIFIQFHSVSSTLRLFIMQGGTTVSGIAGINQSVSLCRPVNKALPVTINYDTGNDPHIGGVFVPYK